jgi:glycosyltransferase involved in cell wall biosynthesis
MPKISVLTPSIRPEYLDITQKCLENQTFQDFEWIVEVGLRNRGFGLPSDMNKMLRRAKGERIVVLQDCIRLEPDALARIHALTNQMWTFPVGKVQNFGDTPQWDWRKDYDKDTLPGPEFWEADFGCGPTEAFREIGGYDERYNQGWSWDNVEVAYRIKATGKYTFHCEPTIVGVALDHDKKQEHPWRNTLESNATRAQETKYRAERGEYKLDYLQ